MIYIYVRLDFFGIRRFLKELDITSSFFPSAARRWFHSQSSLVSDRVAAVSWDFNATNGAGNGWIFDLRIDSLYIYICDLNSDLNSD